MGNLATIGQQGLPNYKHIVINNGAHDSVGAQPTDAQDLEKFNLTKLAKAVGYKMVRTGLHSLSLFLVSLIDQQENSLELIEQSNNLA